MGCVKQSSGRKRIKIFKVEATQELEAGTVSEGSIFYTCLAGCLESACKPPLTGDSLLSDDMHATLWTDVFKHSFSNGSSESATHQA